MRMANYKYISVDSLRSIFLLISLFCLTIPLFSSQPFSENRDNSTKEEKLKAAFIYKFANYVFWPNTDTSLTFNISIIGNSDIFPPLVEIAKNRKIGGREISIHRIRDINNIIKSHILFISVSESNRLSDILTAIGHDNTLTISDSESFTRKGVAINFISRNGRIGFELSQAAINRAGLRVSSQLKKLAVLVDEV